MQQQYSSPSQAATPALEYVGVGRRFVAIFLDGLLLLIPLAIIGMIFHSNEAMIAGGDAWDKFAHRGPGPILQAITPFVYFIVMEALLGATLGKMMLGIRVVRLDGSPIGWSDSIIRNLFRIIDQIPYGLPYLLGAILVWASSRKQRLGDRVAQTVVVRRHSARF